MVSQNNKGSFGAKSKSDKLNKRPQYSKRQDKRRRTKVKMYTHRTADGKGVPEFIIESFDKDESSVDEEDSTSPEACTTNYCLRKTTKYVCFAIFVFLSQIVISVSLKRNGYIEKDFNEIVAERVIPQIQQQLDYSLAAWPQLNESVYWLRINESISQTMTGHVEKQSTRPGYQFAQKGARPKYPIVMIPGFVTSGLEVWGGKECAKKYFRHRMWGGVGSVQHWLMERHCVMEHLALDLVTGKDPEGIRIRAAQGFDAADYFMGNYWVWGKIIENLADIGYDGSMMSMESYDWRLSFPLLEERDGYLTKLKHQIEAFHESTGEKVVLTSHSLGAILVHFFFSWVTAPEKDGGGGGGKDWVNKHIHTFVNIAGVQLGLPKAASALMSGEMSDTIFMGAVASLVEQFIGRKLRRDLWMTWGSLWSMLPKGGDALWSIGADLNGTKLAEEDIQSFEGGNHTPSTQAVNALNHHLLSITDDEETGDSKDLQDLVCAKEKLLDESQEDIVNSALQDFSSRNGHTVSQVIDFLKTYGGGRGPTVSPSVVHSFDAKVKASKNTWHDLSRTPLPKAPDMKIYCLYGVGLPTERAYFYKRNRDETQKGENSSNPPSQVVDPPFIVDTTVDDPENQIVHGVKYADGDGSVPLLSLGYLCADGWRRKDSGLNPGQAKVVTREYEHRGEFTVDDPMRGGRYSAEHVDVLGNVNMMEDFLKIVSDFEVDSIEDQIVSDIENIAKRINEHPGGGLKKRKWWNKA